MGLKELILTLPLAVVLILYHCSSAQAMVKVIQLKDDHVHDAQSASVTDSFGTIDETEDGGIKKTLVDTAASASMTHDFDETDKVIKTDSGVMRHYQKSEADSAHAADAKHKTSVKKIKGPNGAVISQTVEMSSSSSSSSSSSVSSEEFSSFGGDFGGKLSFGKGGKKTSSIDTEFTMEHNEHQEDEELEIIKHKKHKYKHWRHKIIKIIEEDCDQYYKWTEIEEWWDLIFKIKGKKPPKDYPKLPCCSDLIPVLRFRLYKNATNLRSSYQDVFLTTNFQEISELEEADLYEFDGLQGFIRRSKTTEKNLVEWWRITIELTKTEVVHYYTTDRNNLGIYKGRKKIAEKLMGYGTLKKQNPFDMPVFSVFNKRFSDNDGDEKSPWRYYITKNKGEMEVLEEWFAYKEEELILWIRRPPVTIKIPDLSIPMLEPLKNNELPDPARKHVIKPHKPPSPQSVALSTHPGLVPVYRFYAGLRSKRHRFDIFLTINITEVEELEENEEYMYVGIAGYASPKKTPDANVPLYRHYIEPTPWKPRHQYATKPKDYGKLPAPTGPKVPKGGDREKVVAYLSPKRKLPGHDGPLFEMTIPKQPSDDNGQSPSKAPSDHYYTTSKPEQEALHKFLDYTTDRILGWLKVPPVEVDIPDIDVDMFSGPGFGPTDEGGPVRDGGPDLPGKQKPTPGKGGAKPEDNKQPTPDDNEERPWWEQPMSAEDFPKFAKKGLKPPKHPDSTKFVPLYRFQENIPPSSPSKPGNEKPVFPKRPRVFLTPDIDDISKMLPNPDRYSYVGLQGYILKKPLKPHGDQPVYRYTIEGDKPGKPYFYYTTKKGDIGTPEGSPKPSKPPIEKVIGYGSKAPHAPRFDWAIHKLVPSQPQTPDKPLSGPPAFFPKSKGAADILTRLLPFIDQGPIVYIKKPPVSDKIPTFQDNLFPKGPQNPEGGGPNQGMPSNEGPGDENEFIPHQPQIGYPVKDLPTKPGSKTPSSPPNRPDLVVIHRWVRKPENPSSKGPFFPTSDVFLATKPDDINKLPNKDRYHYTGPFGVISNKPTKTANKPLLRVPVRPTANYTEPIHYYTTKWDDVGQLPEPSGPLPKGQKGTSSSEQPETLGYIPESRVLPDFDKPFQKTESLSPSPSQQKQYPGKKLPEMYYFPKSPEENDLLTQILVFKPKKPVGYIGSPPEDLYPAFPEFLPTNGEGPNPVDSPDGETPWYDTTFPATEFPEKAKTGPAPPKHPNSPDVVPLYRFQEIPSQKPAKRGSKPHHKHHNAPPRVFLTPNVDDIPKLLPYPQRYSYVGLQGYIFNKPHKPHGDKPVYRYTVPEPEPGFPHFYYTTTESEFGPEDSPKPPSAPKQQIIGYGSLDRELPFHDSPIYKIHPSALARPSSPAPPVYFTKTKDEADILCRLLSYVNDGPIVWIKKAPETPRIPDFPDNMVPTQGNQPNQGTPGSSENGGPTSPTGPKTPGNNRPNKPDQGDGPNLTNQGKPRLPRTHQPTYTYPVPQRPQLPTTTGPEVEQPSRDGLVPVHRWVLPPKHPSKTGPYLPTGDVFLATNPKDLNSLPNKDDYRYTGILGYVRKQPKAPADKALMRVPVKPSQTNKRNPHPHHYYTMKPDDVGKLPAPTGPGPQQHKPVTLGYASPYRQLPDNDMPLEKIHSSPPSPNQAKYYHNPKPDNYYFPKTTTEKQALVKFFGFQPDHPVGYLKSPPTDEYPDFPDHFIMPTEDEEEPNGAQKDNLLPPGAKLYPEQKFPDKEDKHPFQGLVPLYRARIPSVTGHPIIYLTPNLTEAKSLGPKFIFDGIQGYVFPKQSPTATIPLYRTSRHPIPNNPHIVTYDYTTKKPKENLPNHDTALQVVHKRQHGPQSPGSEDEPNQSGQFGPNRRGNPGQPRAVTQSKQRKPMFYIPKTCTEKDILVNLYDFANDGILGWLKAPPSDAKHVSISPDTFTWPTRPTELVPDSGKKPFVPLYRFSGPLGNVLLSTDRNEPQKSGVLEYVPEGIHGYIPTQPTPEAKLPLYRHHVKPTKGKQGSGQFVYSTSPDDLGTLKGVSKHPVGSPPITLKIGYVSPHKVKPDYKKPIQQAFRPHRPLLRGSGDRGPKNPDGISLSRPFPGSNRVPKTEIEAMVLPGLGFSVAPPLGYIMPAHNEPTIPVRPRPHPVGPGGKHPDGFETPDEQNGPNRPTRPDGYPSDDEDYPHQPSPDITIRIEVLQPEEPEEPYEPDDSENGDQPESSPSTPGEETTEDEVTYPRNPSDIPVYRYIKTVPGKGKTPPRFVVFLTTNPEEPAKKGLIPTYKPDGIQGYASPQPTPASPVVLIRRELPELPNVYEYVPKPKDYPTKPHETKVAYGSRRPYQPDRDLPLFISSQPVDSKQPDGPHAHYIPKSPLEAQLLEQLHGLPMEGPIIFIGKPIPRKRPRGTFPTGLEDGDDNGSDIPDDDDETPEDGSNNGPGQTTPKQPHKPRPGGKPLRPRPAYPIMPLVLTNPSGSDGSSGQNGTVTRGPRSGPRPGGKPKQPGDSTTVNGPTDDEEHTGPKRPNPNRWIRYIPWSPVNRDLTQPTIGQCPANCCS